MEQSERDKKWHEIGDALTGYFQICGCQRKLKTIVDNLVSIKQKCLDAYEKDTPRDFTGAEWLLLAIMERMPNESKMAPVCHGVNCEYPILRQDHEFWKWIDSIKDDPALEDN